MATFSERYGHKSDRSRLYQLEEMDDRFKNAIWNFLLDKIFRKEGNDPLYHLVVGIWTEVAGGRSDDVPAPSADGAMRVISTQHIRTFLREWYFGAAWNAVYDALEYLLRERPAQENISDGNAMLSREGSAYRFVGNVIAPITAEEEIAAVEEASQLSGPLHGASEHIAQAVTHLSDRSAPDYRNAIKESISAVESAVQAAVGDSKVDIEKGLEKLGLHPQLKQAWANMFNWTSDEDGVRHGIKDEPQVGVSEARYMVVACSAFVNYLVAKSVQ